MTRERFLSSLKSALGGMTDTEKREILYDYAEHFRMGAADGKSEEQIAQALGNPRLLGRSYRIDSLLDEPKEGGGVKAGSVVHAVFVSASLGFFNLIFVLGPFLGLVAAMICLWAAAAVLPLSGLALVLAPILYVIAPLMRGYISLGGLPPACLFFVGIGITGLGVIAVMGMWKLSRYFIWVIAAYVRFNARIVTRRR